jgi:hypothetical protein
MKKTTIIALIGTSIALSGCGQLLQHATSGMISDEKLQDKAAFALGVDSSKVKISNRTKGSVMDGGEIKFTATVGKKSYSCYVVSSIGASSDAICSGGGKKTCDALSKRAGKC